MKQYAIQLNTGVIFKTSQEIVYTQEGYAIDRQAVTPDDYPINGRLYVGNDFLGIEVTDMVFNSSNVVASWYENN